MAKKHRNRTPKLRFTSWRGIGWHVSYRDPATRSPRKHVFNIREREREAEARLLYHAWVLEHMGGKNPNGHASRAALPPRSSSSKLLSGSVLDVATGLIESERLRARTDDGLRRRGTIAAAGFRDRTKQIHDFLSFLNERHGPGAVTKLRIPDLTMEDVESYNQAIVKRGLSASQVAKRLQFVKAIIDRAGRPEHGRQILGWNWTRGMCSMVLRARTDFPDRGSIAATSSRIRPSRANDDLAGARARLWSPRSRRNSRGADCVRPLRPPQDQNRRRAVRVTPPIVWAYVSKYQALAKRPKGELLFLTRNGLPLVQSSSNAVVQWWKKLRNRVKKPKEKLLSFYTLRHLGATEFGSRRVAHVLEGTKPSSNKSRATKQRHLFAFNSPPRMRPPWFGSLLRTQPSWSSSLGRTRRENADCGGASEGPKCWHRFLAC